MNTLGNLWAAAIPRLLIPVIVLRLCEELLPLPGILQFLLAWAKHFCVKFPVHSCGGRTSMVSFRSPGGTLRCPQHQRRNLVQFPRGRNNARATSSSASHPDHTC